MIAMPLTRVPPGQLRRVVVPASVAFVLALLPFALIDGTNEMVCLQLAGSDTDAQEIIRGWSDADIRDMALLQGVDNVLPLAYGSLLAAGAVWSGRRLRERAAWLAPVVAWTAVAAALCDLLENVGMILMIRGHIDPPVPTITTSFAIVKYLTLVAVLLYISVGVAALVRGGRTSAADPQ